MSIEAQIEELRAELEACTDTREIAMIEREYRAALAEKQARDSAFDALDRAQN